MQHLLTPYANPIQPYIWWEGVFTERELDILQRKAIEADAQAQVGSNAGSEHRGDLRRSRVSWVNKNPDTAWIFEKLAHAASCINAKYYNFDLTGFGEALQLTNYDQSEHGMYGWHQDYGSAEAPSRKLSMVVQLTDPSQYEGGNLEVLTSPTPHVVRKQRGLIAAFPAYALHQVTPVTKGSRQSLVAWISGPAFR